MAEIHFFSKAGLLAAINTLNEAQLAQFVTYWGENVGGKMLRPGCVGGIPITYDGLANELRNLGSVASDEEPTYRPSRKASLLVIKSLEVLENDFVNPSGDGAELADSYRPQPGEEFKEGEHMTEEEMAAGITHYAGQVVLCVDYEEVSQPTPGFFMVYAEGGYPPSKRHDNLVSAIKEAERIARKNNSSTYVLQTVQKIAATTSFERTPLRS